MKVQPNTHNKPHILIDALNLAHGGGVVVMARLARAFDDAGYKVTVLAARTLPDLDFAQSKIILHVIAKARGSAAAFIYRFFSLDKLAKNLGADAMLGFNYYSPSTLPQATYHINVIPFLKLRERVASTGMLRALVLGAIARKALRKSQVNLFESRHVQDLASARVSSINQPRLAYIGSELPPPSQHAALASAGGPIITITSGAGHKRNDLTLKFFRQVLQEDPTARLSVLGNAHAILNSLSPADKDFVKTCSAVSFAGYLPRAQLFDYLSRARALVTFSELESFFMVAVEAMAVGCPVIASDNSSARESIGKGGILVPSGDISAASTALLSLGNPATRAAIAKQGQSWALAFDAERCANEFVRQFESGLGLHFSAASKLESLT